MTFSLLLHFLVGIESGDLCLLNSEVLPCFSGVITSIKSLGVVDSLLQSLEHLGHWESLPVVGSLPRSSTVFHGR